MSQWQQSVIIDNGTGFTKMGFSYNNDPHFVFPTAVADLAKKSTLSVSTKNDEYYYFIGDDGIKKAQESENYALTYPMQNGIIENWDIMEKFWHQSIYNYMKCDPQEHNFVLTEPPMNPPENRENMAEIFFETFNVPGLYIGVQAVFALMGCHNVISHLPPEERNIDPDQEKAMESLTGMVVDSGDGVTHVVPICDGYVLGSNIKHIPIAGRKITKFMMQMIKNRNETIRPEDWYYATMDLKEKYGYVAEEILKEYEKYDKKKWDDKTKQYIQSAKFKKFEGFGKISRKPFSLDLGYELFLGPESFFSPEIIDKEWSVGLDDMIDKTVQQCPVDYRRKLYANIVLSGGSTQFKRFDQRLTKNLQMKINARLDSYTTKDFKPKMIKVNVAKSFSQKHVVWLGGSTISESPHFPMMVHTREEYSEKGPSCCRFNTVFSV